MGGMGAVPAVLAQGTQGTQSTQGTQGTLMLLQTLYLLQTWLLPLVLAALAVGAVLVWLVGRKPTHKPGQRAAPAPVRPQPTARQTAPAISPQSARQSAPQSAPKSAPQPAPKSAPKSAPGPAPAPPAPIVALTADLLLVDDSAVVRAKLRRLFEPAGYRICLARDGQEALALLQQGRYGLMVTDLEMPRLDGVGLIRAVLDHPASAGMPILAITGHDDLQAQLSQLQAVTGIYRKPWLDDDLLGHVQSLLSPANATSGQTEDA